jgi:hypothetical protein
VVLASPPIPRVTRSRLPKLCPETRSKQILCGFFFFHFFFQESGFKFKKRALCILSFIEVFTCTHPYPALVTRSTYNTKNKWVDLSVEGLPP